MSALRRYRWAILVGVFVLIVAALVGPGIALGPSVDVEQVVRQDFVQTVVASGRVETPHRVEVGVTITGVVRRVAVREGDEVKAGDTLLELDPTELRAALDQAQRAAQGASARVRQMQEVQAPVAVEAVGQARLRLEGARDALRRSRALFGAGAISAAARDDAERAEQVADAQLRAAIEQAASARPAGSEAMATQAALAQAQAGVGVARARLAAMTITAPTGGTVLVRAVEPGDVVQPGRTVMVLSPSGDVQLTLTIDEKQLQLLVPGLAALASADAYPAQRFSAEVASISPGVDAQRGTVTVKLRVSSPPAYLKQDMTVSVDIEIARRSKAVLVPRSAVHDADSLAPWVLRVEGRQARRRAVTLGLRSDGLCEVLSGVTEGDRVVPVATTTIVDGARLRAVVPPQ
jgi:HlyD family secretion protein